MRLDQVAERPYFVDASPPHLRRAFVVWDESRTWPPPADAAQGLAMALADALGINLVETFLAFIQSDDVQRRRLLDIAGASAMLAEVEHELADAGGEPRRQPEDEPDGREHPRSNPRARRRRRDEQAPRPPSGPAPAPAPVPLVRFEDLTIDGEPIVVAGETPRDRDRNGGNGTGPDREGPPTRPGRAAAGTDLGALDALGMRITIAYEVHRLLRAGLADAQALIPRRRDGRRSRSWSTSTAPRRSARPKRRARPPSACSATSRRRASAASTPASTCSSSRTGRPTVSSSCKSSGVDAYVQTMSWNEWKSARASHLRPLFWLYLVGNLRADLATSAPFVRAIGDPFGSLVADEVHEQQVRRAVQLRVREFTEAEHLDLGVSTPPSGV